MLILILITVNVLLYQSKALAKRMPIKYIGRTTDFKGKTLWEILGNLKNFGVGRMIIRNKFQRYPEPCYMRILKIATLPAPATEKPNVRYKAIHYICLYKSMYIL